MSGEHPQAFSLPTDHVFGGPASRQPRPKRKKPPREENRPTRTRSILSFEASVALHLVAFWLLTGLPQPAPAAKEEKQPEIIPIEVAFLPQPMAPAPKVAAPGPEVKPEPEALPKAPERPAPKPARQQAAAIKPKPPRPAAQAVKPAPRQAQREVPKPKQPDLQALLNARMNQAQTQEEQRLAQLRDAARSGSAEAPKAPAAGVEHGDPTTTGSGLSGALAQRTPLSQPLPAYPTQAQRLGDEGSVRVRLWVNATGAVTRVEVLRSSGRGYFDRAAVAAVKRWAFSPLADGGVGEQYGDLTLTFDLR